MIDDTVKHTNVRPKLVCARCREPVTVADKRMWVATDETGVYRLQHRDCDHPDCYEHASDEAKRISARMRRTFGRRLTGAQRRLLDG